MKQIFRILAVALFTPIFFSCDDFSENTNVTLVDTLAVDTVVDPLAGYSSKFKTLVATDSGLFRGRKFGTTKAQTLETGLEKIEEDSVSVTYNINLSATEYGDIMYTFNKGTFSSLEVFVYPKDDSSLQALKGELVDFYSKKIGATVVKKKNKTTLLNPENNYGIEWSEEGNKKIKDLRMYIFSLSA
jgi:hypothetical protein